MSNDIHIPQLDFSVPDEVNRAACEEGEREGVAMEEVDFEEVQLVEDVTKEPQDTPEGERKGVAMEEVDFEEVQLVEDVTKEPQDSPEARSQTT